MATIAVEKILAATPVTVRGQPTPLSADAKGERIAYASGKSIFVRSIDNPAECKQYTGHTAATTVARFSPSGYYVASGDVSGQVRVWDAVEAVQTKGEYAIVSGRINDVAWDGDSQRLIAVGDGRERFGHCITADSGNSVGEVSGHSQTVNAVALRQQRPLRAATVSDDGAMCFLHGAPFKFARKADGLHKGFVYGAAFSPDGSLLVTVGADRRIQLYEGKTGEPTTTVGDGAHTGSIFAVSWAADSKRFATASADQTVRVWDAASGAALHTWRLGATVADQQVGVVWPHGRADDLIISLSLSGDLNYLRLDGGGGDKPARVVQGHNKAVTAMGSSGSGSDHDVLTGSFDGRVCHWDVAAGTATVVAGDAHTNQVVQFATTAAGATCSVAWDDTLRTIEAGGRAFASGDGGAVVALGGQPRGVAAAADGLVVVALASDKLAVYRGGQAAPVGELALDYTPTAVAAHGALVAVGGGLDAGKVAVYTLAGASGKLTLAETVRSPVASAVSALAFSGDGRLLAAGHANGKIVAFRGGGGSGSGSGSAWTVATDRWSAHTARVTALAWNPAGTHAASGALDTNVHVWSLAKPGSRVKAANAHKDGVNGVAWVGNGGSKVASVGGDAAVKIWAVSGLQ